MAVHRMILTAQAGSDPVIDRYSPVHWRFASAFRASPTVYPGVGEAKQAVRAFGVVALLMAFDLPLAGPKSRL